MNVPMRVLMCLLSTPAACGDAEPTDDPTPPLEDRVRGSWVVTGMTCGEVDLGEELGVSVGIVVDFEGLEGRVHLDEDGCVKTLPLEFSYDDETGQLEMTGTELPSGCMPAGCSESCGEPSQGDGTEQSGIAEVDGDYLFYTGDDDSRRPSAGCLSGGYELPAVMTFERL